MKLEKDSYGSLGFSVAGAASLGGCYIKKIIKDPALAEGTLQPGDKLLEVCNIVKSPTTWSFAVFLGCRLWQSTGVVCFYLCLLFWTANMHRRSLLDIYSIFSINALHTLAGEWT